MPMAPMLEDHAWHQLARSDETLCGVCMFNRAAQMRIKLRLADLVPCPFNLQNGMFCWFNFFVRNEPAAPKNLRRWRNALRETYPMLLG
jgi:hypothetical protein